MTSQIAKDAKAFDSMLSRLTLNQYVESMENKLTLRIIPVENIS